MTKQTRDLSSDCRIRTSITKTNQISGAASLAAIYDYSNWDPTKTCVPMLTEAELLSNPRQRFHIRYHQVPTEKKARSNHHLHPFGKLMCMYNLVGPSTIAT
jgi:hypothetical protein